MIKQLALIKDGEQSLQVESRELTFKPVLDGFQVEYEHPHGRLYQGDSIQWLTSLDSSSVDLVFADPPYNILL